MIFIYLQYIMRTIVSMNPTLALLFSFKASSYTTFYFSLVIILS